MYLMSCVVAMAVASSCLSAPIPKGTNEVDYFPLAKGNTWEFTRFAGMAEDKWTMTVAETTQKEGKLAAVLKCQKHNSAFDARFEADRSGVYRFSSYPNKAASETPVKLLPKPLEAGATWDSSLPLPFFKNFGKAKAEAKGLVEVKVAAGKFQAMEVVVRFWNFEYDAECTVTSWYAPGVGVVKQVYAYPGGGSMTVELTKFTPGK